MTGRLQRGCCRYLHGFGRDLCLGPYLQGAGALVHQHGEAIGPWASAGRGLL